MTHEGCGCQGPSVLVQTTLPYLMLIYLTLYFHVLMQHELNGRLLCVKCQNENRELWTSSVPHENEED